MSDLHERLKAAIEARLATARAAQPGPWHIGNAVDPTQPCNVHTFPGARFVADGCPWLDAEHIAANGPDVVERGCLADLRRLERHRPHPEDPTACWRCTRLAGEHQSYPCIELRDVLDDYRVAEGGGGA